MGAEADIHASQPQPQPCYAFNHVDILFVVYSKSHVCFSQAKWIWTRTWPTSQPTSSTTCTQVCDPAHQNHPALATGLYAHVGFFPISPITVLDSVDEPAPITRVELRVGHEEDAPVAAVGLG
jgi:hypothetical protein